MEDLTHNVYIREEKRDDELHLTNEHGLKAKREMIFTTKKPIPTFETVTYTQSPNISFRTRLTLQ